jgi:hypothetical protein
MAAAGYMRLPSATARRCSMATFEGELFIYTLALFLYFDYHIVVVGGRDIHFSFRLVADVVMRANWLRKHNVNVEDKDKDNVAVTLLFDHRPAAIKDRESEKRRL